MKTILTPDQKAAFEQLHAFATGQDHAGHAMAALEGFAGTGKTTLMAQLLHELPAHLRVAVMAPTNKAVGVLQARLGEQATNASVEFGSLHSFLGLRLKEREDGSQSCEQDGSATLHQYDLAIVDECSMVSEELFSSVLRSKRNCRVLFVGDPAQLPPVGDDGRDSPVFRMVNLKLRLNTVVRQAASNPIIGASMVVRRAIEQGRRVCLQELVDAFPVTQPCAIGVLPGGRQTIVDGLVHEFREGRQARAVAWRNDSVQSINARCHAAIFPASTAAFEPGETVVAQSEFRTEYEPEKKQQRVFNSEECTIDRISRASHPHYPDIACWRVEMLRDDGSALNHVYVAADERQLKNRLDSMWREFRALKADGRQYSKAKQVSSGAWALQKAFAPLRHTYAVTSHKSQGSTFDTVFMDWDDMMGQRNDFEFNRMVYVAMTRASKFLAVVVSA